MQTADATQKRRHPGNRGPSEMVVKLSLQRSVQSGASGNDLLFPSRELEWLERG